MKITENLHEIISDKRLYFYDDTVGAQCAIYLGTSRRLGLLEIEENIWHPHWPGHSIEKSRIISQKLPGLFIKEKDVVVTLARCRVILTAEDVYHASAKENKDRFIFVCYYKNSLIFVYRTELTFI